MEKKNLSSIREEFFFLISSIINFVILNNEESYFTSGDINLK